MKFFLATVVTLFSLSVAQADSGLVCFTGQFGADGTITLISSGGPQVFVAQNDTLATYTLKDPFGLYNPMYNIHNPISMSLLASAGPTGAYTTTGTAIAASFPYGDDGTTKTTLIFSADSAALTGHIETQNHLDTDGSYTGGYQGDVVCGTAGTTN